MLHSLCICLVLLATRECLVYLLNYGGWAYYPCFRFSYVLLSDVGGLAGDMRGRFEVRSRPGDGKGLFSASTFISF